MRRRSYHRNARSDYGRERARAHIEAARAFSAEVGNADEVVKDAFFSLSGASRSFILDKYESMYGAGKRRYAQAVLPKWESGEVQMSGEIAERIFTLMPPFMPITQKHRIFEIVWKQYGPRSNKYLYLGPDSNSGLVIDSIEKYFAGIEVNYGIPPTLERRFDWLSDNDVTVKHQLLNHFMNEQLRVAIMNAKFYIETMLDAMKGSDFAQISKLSHTIFVGNHFLEIKADPLRSGFLVSDSDRDGIRPKPKVSWPSVFMVAVLIVVAATWLLGGSHAASAP